MDLPLPSGVKSTVSWVDISRLKWPKTQTSADNFFGHCILGGTRYFVHWLPQKRKNHQSQILLAHLKEEIAKKWLQIKKEIVLFHQDNALGHKSIAMMAKLHELHFELCLHPPYSPDLAISDYWLFADLKRMFQRKRLGSNEKVILETEAYFKAKDKLFNKKGIELLEKRRNQCITLEGDYVNE